MKCGWTRTEAIGLQAFDQLKVSKKNLRIAGIERTAALQKAPQEQKYVRDTAVFYVLRIHGTTLRRPVQRSPDALDQAPHARLQPEIWPFGADNLKRPLIRVKQRNVVISDIQAIHVVVDSARNFS
jgi:hypothetical protein